MAIEGFPKYEVNCREGIVRNVKRLRVLKPRLGGDGYPKFEMRKDGKLNTKKIHRIVAESAFGYYGIPTDGLLVLHLDETRTNSCIDNLALGTTKENMNFPKYKQRKSKAMTGKRHSEDTRKKLSEALKGKPKIKLSKRVGAYKNGELVMEFESTREACRNGFNCSSISKCCSGKLKHHKGYNWKYLSA